MALRISTASTIDCSEVIDNQGRKIGAALYYYPAIVYRNSRRIHDGQVDAEGFPITITEYGRFREVALFTEGAIEEAIKRGAANREDVEAWLGAERREGVLMGTLLGIAVASTVALLAVIVTLST